MTDPDLRWQKTNSLDEFAEQADSIPSGALVIDANGRKFYKASCIPAEEQWFEWVEGDGQNLGRHLGGYPIAADAPFEFLGPQPASASGRRSPLSDSTVPATWYLPTGAPSIDSACIAIEGNPGTFTAQGRGGLGSYSLRELPADAILIAGVDPRA
ncbi:hypothetical protein [Gordonia rubripertincta]|uniref:hypothetical protein n=1 Tax=Gordonia rubripertincta TaxID=36822 RepID=UPI0015F89038|nr:hypothetical protein [Gordonia rubripertincta]QMU19371.1 hypothetical protein H3V45_14865 [Gordonia rubripertincta]